MARDPDQRLLLLEAFGRRVRSLRTLAGLTQEQLADAAQLHRVTIAKVESGRREIGLVSIAALAHALGLTPSELVADVEADSTS